MRRGVGYSPLPGARSLAGTGHGHPAILMNTIVDPWAGGTFRRELMAERYGPWWESGAPGYHSNVFEGELRERFADRTARWPVDYSQWDGVPTQREVTDAYYTQDQRVRPVVVALPPPPPAPPPAPPPVTPPPGPPATNLAPLDQRVLELVTQCRETLDRIDVPPLRRWAVVVIRAALEAAVSTGLAPMALRHAVALKRRILGEG